ncbi:alpha,alpha-trehalose phosphorylase/kojibiose phosphorylase [Kineococcus xinjiangensis]|uniref:Alpha,alpha-trehalose phosphorylase/kojibiose phosphorylase n=1 Tax=Kineococcus xinjiangensis TaxID=512762 RepID=A0A2S6IC23_9ACTN|nr:glycosyl hydrolase family 65 protein [Kineococcus xinjiangensis]PPK90802.1 alpha,alpha-trehalose phosphorylase/kojibiose phosphorylase [Kineococcus xinjiangensis]
MDLDPAEPWAVREGPLDLSQLERTESLLALSNGRLGVRGGLDEGAPEGAPGTYLSGAYEVWPMTHPEYSYGYPRVQDRIVGVPDATRVELFVEGERFDVRTGELHEHDRTLDLRSGTLRRTVRWTSPTGVTVRIRSERLVPLEHPRLMAVDYRVKVLDAPHDRADQGIHVEVRSAAVASEELHDPVTQARRTGGSLRQRTDGSGQAIAVVVEHDVTGPADTAVRTHALPQRVVTTADTRLSVGSELRVVKCAALGWADKDARADLLDELRADLDVGVRAGWEGLAAEQRRVVGEFWEHADVRVEGDEDLQQAVRFALFHVLQATAQAADRGIPAKGLTGTGYDGHTFWDTEVFVLPMLNHVRPAAAAAALRWRHAMLPAARERAAELGLAGATFPWRTITGRECSGYWPAGTAAVHLNADIADAAVRHLAATGDEELAREVVTDLVVETARTWGVLGREDDEGRFHVDGVTGPDEYSALVDDNAYTNLMAQANLRAALDLVRRFPDRAAALGVDDEEVATWERLADAVHVPRAADGMHLPHARSGAHLRWDFEGTSPQQYPLADHFPYFSLYRRQVAKQVDLVLAMHLRPDAFTPEEKRRAFDYCEGVTVRDSSLSASTQAVVAAEVGHLGLAEDYVHEAAFVDLHDLRDSTADGLHIASLAGAWSALVAGYGGMRDADGRLAFTPRLPAGLTELCFRTLHRGSCLEVRITRQEATYTVVSGGPVDTCHHGEEFTVEQGSPRTLRIEPLPEQPRPAQPKGRDPRELRRR